MTDLAKVSLPRGDGPITWTDLAMVLREVLAKQDIRYPQNDFASGLLANANGSVTVGTQAIPTGRTVGLPTLVSKIGDIGRAQDQRFMPMVNTGNRNSAQNINPLSSTGSAATAAIAVAAHTVQFGFGIVSYGAGSITGLTPLTNYHIYAADPTFAGGAVAYTATLARTDVVAADGYYYVGEIQTTNTTPTGSVTAATSTSPIVITIVGHAFVTGNTVLPDDFPGDFAALDGNMYTATVLSADTFSVPVDGSLFAAYVGPAGTVVRVAPPTDGVGSGGGWGYTP